jgi:hypothetical protein
LLKKSVGEVGTRHSKDNAGVANIIDAVSLQFRPKRQGFCTFRCYDLALIVSKKWVKPLHILLSTIFQQALCINHFTDNPASKPGEGEAFG